MSTTTTRLGLTKPATGDVVPTLRTSIGANADALDNAATITTGVFASRPSTAVVGQFFYATDTGLLYVCITAPNTWVNVNRPVTTFRTTNTFSVAGEIRVPVGNLDVIPGYFVSLYSTQTAKLISVRSILGSGTSVDFKLTKNNVDITGFTGLSTGPGLPGYQADPADVTVANSDLIALVVTAVSGTPRNLTVSLTFEHSV